MVAATMCAVFWIGWSVPTDRRQVEDLPAAVRDLSSDGVTSADAARMEPIAASASPGGSAAPAPNLTPPAATAASFAGRIDLNRAEVDQLHRLPGIGPALAARVVEFRRVHGPFATVDDLLQVKGIGPKRLDRLRGQVMVGGVGPQGQGGRL